MSISPALLLVSAATAEFIWWTSLGIFAVVLLVVAVLLQSVLGVAKDILAGVADIWTVGKQIAGNTVQIAALGGINRSAGKIVEAVGALHESLVGIEQHADGCPGCPQCMLHGPSPSPDR